MSLISSRLSSFLSDVQAELKRSLAAKKRENPDRKNAVRYKLTNIFGHKLQVCLLKEPTKCSQCFQAIWGLIGQQCKLCKLSCHNNSKCIDLIDSHCAAATSTATPCHKSHKFESTYFLTPTCCDHCGTFLIGLIGDQGLECSECASVAHFDCHQFISSKCDKECRSSKQSKISKSSTSTPSKQLEQATTENAYEHHSRMSFEDFKPIAILGIGSFSKVYLAELKTTREKFAIKIIKKTTLSVSSDPESASTEMRTLQLGRNFPFLAIAHCCFQSKERLFFVMEHVKGKNFYHYIRESRKFSEERTRFYTAEIVLALIYLHKQGIVHRDLKAENVFLTPCGHCKLIDFGMSKELGKTISKRTNTFCGTPDYIAPEIIKELDYDFSVDWWSLGVLVHEMLLGCLPFEADDEKELYRHIVETELHLGEYFWMSERARDLLEGLLTKEPQNRLGCQTNNCQKDPEQALLEHPFFLTYRLAWSLEEDGSCTKARQEFWDKVLRKQMLVPYLPPEELFNHTDHLGRQSSIDSQLTPVEISQLDKIPQDQFAGFSFCSESFTSLNLIT